MPATTLLSPALMVVDTDVVSFLFKQDSRVGLYRAHLEGVRPVISAQTLAELRHWPEWRNWGLPQRRKLDAFLLGYPVIHTDDDICRIWGVVTAEARRHGMPTSATDAWNAATALHLGVPLVTHNPDDYRGVPTLHVVSAVTR